MDFSTVVVIVLVAAIGWTLFKVFGKKETIAEAIKEEVAEVKAVEAKAKTAVKKATTRKPKAAK